MRWYLFLRHRITSNQINTLKEFGLKRIFQFFSAVCFAWCSLKLFVNPVTYGIITIMTGEKIRTMRKDHNKANKNEELRDTHDETSNETISNGTSNNFTSNKAFHKSVKSSTLQQQQQLNAKNINGNPSSVDSNKNPIILTSTDFDFPVHECVFRGDVRRLSSLIRTHSISQKDVHGECPTSAPYIAIN